LSTVRSAFAATRSEKVWPSASECKDTFTRLGRNRRLVCTREWLTLLPVIGRVPVRSQTRDIARSSMLVSVEAASLRARPTLVNRYNAVTTASVRPIMAEDTERSLEIRQHHGKPVQLSLCQRSICCHTLQVWR
jgi:hypothetical protein